MNEPRRLANRWPWVMPGLRGLCVYYLTTLLVACAFLAGLNLVRDPAAEPRRRNLIDALALRDGGAYKSIVEQGYTFDKERQSNVAFFPLYPILAWCVRFAFGIRTEVALAVVSNACFAASCAWLACYARDRGITDKGAAECSVVVMALFPAGCFFRLAFSESTFLLISIAVLYAIQRRRAWYVVALLVGAGTAARPVGVALVLPLMLYVVRIAGTRRERVIRSLGGIVLGCSGLVAFIAYQSIEFESPAAFIHTQSHWHVRAPVARGELLWKLATLEPLTANYSRASDGYWAHFDRGAPICFNVRAANPVYFLVAAALLSIGIRTRRLNSYETIFSAAVIAIPYCARGYEMAMGSMGRFVSVAFPLYLVAGAVFARVPPMVCGALCGLSGLVLGVYVALYAAGYAIL